MADWPVRRRAQTSKLGVRQMAAVRMALRTCSASGCIGHGISAWSGVTLSRSYAMYKDQISGSCQPMKPRDYDVRPGPFCNPPRHSAEDTRNSTPYKVCMFCSGTSMGLSFLWHPFACIHGLSCLHSGVDKPTIRKAMALS